MSFELAEIPRNCAGTASIETRHAGRKESQQHRADKELAQNMALRFAPATLPGRSPAQLPVARAMVGRAIERVANDNGAPPLGQSTNDDVLRAALRHFARHGIGAARDARAQAEQAFFADDRQKYDLWMDITRVLDRRLAEEAARMTPGFASS